ncbi:hypothetical protein C272_03695 [Brevibacterium casei S18]|uniref:Uncharacterized protein n=1 Tax=Brevibacterium casei S18 TaxID=1229781 RepID=K9B4A1_9MICO|nr:hypothetical protein C272_03695 [Brevibacterium casei S18]
MFHHLMTRLTLLTLGWADDDQASPGGRVLPRRTAGHRRRTVTGPGSGFSPARTDRDRPDRGDVPGWVLITLMTAGLVVALWALAGEAFTTMFEDAMNKVRGAG